MKIVVVTPAGRERYLKLLYKQLNIQRKSFDNFEWHLWENTRNDNDKTYITKLADHNDWIKIIEKNIDNRIKGTNIAIAKFWEYTTDPNTIYIRLDDDIVWLDKNFIPKALHIIPSDFLPIFKTSSI